VSFEYWRVQNLTSALKPLSANSNLAVSSSSSAALTADKGDFVNSVVGWLLSEEARSYARQNNQDYCYGN
jgi:hypothetical protein